MNEIPANRSHPFNFHTCNCCTFKTRSLRTILSHVKKHQPKSEIDAFFTCELADLEPFECQFCDFKHDLKLVLDKHALAHRLVPQPASEVQLNGYKCDKCDFQTHSLLVFARHNCTKRLKCKKCSEMFKSKVTLYRHELYVHKKLEKKFSCQYCPVFKSKWKCALTRHMSTQHEKQQNLQKFRCEQCSYSAFWKEDLEIHVKTKHREFFTCDLCPFKTPCKKSHRAHMRYTHSSSEKLPCEQCPRVFKNKLTLRNHIAKKHPREELEVFRCGKCNYDTIYIHTFKLHMQQRHGEQVEWLQCDECGKKFKEKRCLEEHKKTRHVRQWFRCEQCEFETHSKQFLESHERWAHGKMVFNCDRCFYSGPFEEYNIHLMQNVHMVMYHQEPLNNIEI